MDAPECRDLEHFVKEGLTNHITPPGEGTSCPTCREDYRSDESELVVATKSCMKPHSFHAKCLLIWLRVNGNNTCPICRNQLYGPAAGGVAPYPLTLMVETVINDYMLRVAIGSAAPYAGDLGPRMTAFRVAAETFDRLYEDHIRLRDSMHEASADLQNARAALVIAKEKIKSTRNRTPDALDQVRAAEEELQMYDEIHEKFREDYEKAVDRADRALAELYAARQSHEDARDIFIRQPDE